jgi:lysophospholipid acyltransferase (LPLAT)-like uncharacterized protein
MIYCYLRLLFLTYRLEVVDHNGSALPLNKSTGLYYLWHGHTICGLYFLYRQKAFGHLVSDYSVDGRLAGFSARKLGLRVMYSNQKPSFMRHAIDVLEMNKRMYMVGDGSEGPAFRLQREIPYLCARTNTPLIHLECKASSAVALSKRWDQLKIPLPFSKITVTIHPPRTFAFDEGHEVTEQTDAATCTSSSDS